jgi:hypothetical protein
MIVPFVIMTECPVLDKACESLPFLNEHNAASRPKSTKFLPVTAS